MRLLVGIAHAPVLVANVASIATCSVVNYLVNDRWVFRQVSWHSLAADIENGRGERSF
jgi:putative flippase GtrA